MPTYTADPFRFDHTLTIGDNYQPAEVELRTVDEDEVDAGPHDLTGVTGTCSIRTEPGGGEEVLAPTVTLTDAEEGLFTWSADPDDTEDVPPGTYHCTVRLTWPGGVERTIVYGTVTAVRR